MLTAASSGLAEEAEPEPEFESEWTGFLACGFGTPVLLWNICEEVDPGHRAEHEFTVDEGLKTLVVALEWDPAVVVGSDSLRIVFDEPGDPGVPTGTSYWEETGGSPIEFRIDAGPGFEEPTEPLDLQFRVTPPFEFAVVYQQPFTVHYHFFYEDYAPEGYSALP